MIYHYRGNLYPEYLRTGNAAQHVIETAKFFCKGQGVDIGCGPWPFPGAVPVELKEGGDAMNVPEGPWDYAFSSHCLEHLVNPVAAIEHWRDRLKSGGVLFLHLPHPDMEFWRPQFCKRHLHLFHPKDTAKMVRDLGFRDVIHSERDLCWSFQVVGFKS